MSKSKEAPVVFTPSHTPLAAVGEKKPKTGNGNATLRTATAAAKAAEAARDLAKKAARESEQMRDEAWGARRCCEIALLEADRAQGKTAFLFALSFAANLALLIVNLLFV